MTDVDVPTESNGRTRFFYPDFWGTELLLLFVMGVSVYWFFTTDAWLFRNGQRADVRVVAELSGHYEVVYGDLVVEVSSDEGSYDVGDTISVLVDPDNPNVMVDSDDVYEGLTMVPVALLAPFAFPVGRLLYVRHIRRASRPVVAPPPSGVPEPVARDPQADPSR